MEREGKRAAIFYNSEAEQMLIHAHTQMQTHIHKYKTQNHTHTHSVYLALLAYNRALLGLLRIAEVNNSTAFSSSPSLAAIMASLRSSLAFSSISSLTYQQPQSTAANQQGGREDS